MAAVDEHVLEAVRAGMRAKSPKAPSAYDRVYKEECCFSFDTPLSPGGLFVNLHTWQAYGADYVRMDAQRSGNRLYLHEKWTKVPLPEEEAAKQAAKPERLAIGGEGGFQTEASKFTLSKAHALVVLPEMLSVPLPCLDLPELVLGAIQGVMAHEGAGAAEEAARWEEERRVSRYADGLPLLEQGLGRWGRAIPADPALWACDETGVKENLWLNLSTGFIGSGRQNWDGSGGNGAALRHFEATGGRYPLAVKLGTITPHGADVYSYAPDENDMVLDPKLAEHLAHWGINMVGMQKTEKTMAELQIDLNMSFEFDKITESGATLQPLSGPGYVGLTNLGNSCYMNSVLQALWALPQVAARYAAPAQEIFRSAPADPASDFPTQMAKLGVAITEGRTGAVPAAAHDADEPMASADEPTANGSAVGAHSAAEGHKQRPEEEGTAVRPAAFKSLVGRGHAEFASNRQQDAAEYYQHLLDVMTRSERVSSERLGSSADDATSAPTTAAAFQFAIEDRIVCAESGAVSYRRTPANMLSLDIDPAAATNADELEEHRERTAKRARLKEENASAYIQAGASLPDGDAPSPSPAAISRDAKEERVLPRVPFGACVDAWGSDEEMGDYHSAYLGRRTTARRSSRIVSFPPFLMVQLKRYYVDKDWTAKKLEVLVDVPDALSLEHLRARGPQPGEQLQPEEDARPQAGAAAGAAAAAVPAAAAAAGPPAVQPDPEIVAALTGMGFSKNGSKRAAVATQNAGTEACMEWVLSHMEDADFNDPLPAPPAAAAAEDSAKSGASSAPAPDPESVAMLSSMGFTCYQATAALRACDGSLERAADWLFSRGDTLDADVAAVLNPAAPAGPASTPAAAAGNGLAAAPAMDDGPGRYELVGIISHMGSNTACGHYVAHIRKAGRWVIYNDDKVAVSENPPRDLGYLYLFRREDVAM